MHSYKFEPGDFVRCLKRVPYKETIFRFTEHDVNGAFNDIIDQHCVLWEPREKEWCWWWNDGDEIPIIRKGYKRIWDNKIVADMGPGKCKEFQYCEPFIGELPSILKKI